MGEDQQSRVGKFQFTELFRQILQFHHIHLGMAGAVRCKGGHFFIIVESGMGVCPLWPVNMVGWHFHPAELSFAFVAGLLPIRRYGIA